MVSNHPTATQGPLISIPLEILLQITRQLTTPEYCSVRLTCRALEATLRNAFAREFFTKRQFFVWAFSLQTLVDISNSRFAPSLTHVILGLEQPLSDLSSATSLINTFPDTTTLASHHQNQLKEYVGQVTLLNTGHEVDLLAEAFSKLPNLETIGIRDFYSNSRYRDASLWLSYGISTFRERTHLKPRFSGSGYQDSEYTSRVFMSLLRALGNSGSRPAGFEIFLRHASFLDMCFDLPPYLLPVVEPVLATLRTLIVDLGFSFRAIISNDVGETPTSANTSSIPGLSPASGSLSSTPSAALASGYQRLKRFLSLMHTLQHLRLNFKTNPDHQPSQLEGSGLLSWLANPATIDIPNLRCLELGFVRAHLKTLLALFNKFQQSMRSFSFHKLTLLHEKPEVIEDDSSINLWAELFGQMSTKLNLTLSDISLSDLTQAPHGEHHIRDYTLLAVTFKGSRKPSSKKWAGNDTQSGLRDLVSLVEVEKQRPFDPVSDYDSDGDHEVDEEDDDGDGDGSEDD